MSAHDDTAPSVGAVNDVPGARERIATRIAFFIGGFAISAWAPLIPFAKHKLALDDGQLGLMLLCLGVGSVLMMPLAGGLAALAAHTAGLPIALSLASHLLSAGCMGTMILGMIARVSLGHSGRALQVGRRITAAFALIVLSAIVRVFLPLFWPGLSLAGWNLSGWSWIAAYGLFVWVYAPLPTSPRADGRPG